MAFVSSADVISALEAQGNSVRVSASLPEWPVRLSVLDELPDGNTNGLMGRYLVVVGSTLGDNCIRVPDEYAKRCVVLYMMNHVGEPRYGYAAARYVSGVAASWEGDVDLSPAVTVLALINCLIKDWGVDGGLYMIGVSAGNPKIWSLINAMSDDLISTSLRLVVHNAGAWHPWLLSNVSKRLGSTRVRHLVHHHSLDTLCNWTQQLASFWQTFVNNSNGTAGLILMSSKDSTFVGVSYHNIWLELGTQKPFWSLF